NRNGHGARGGRTILDFSSALVRFLVDHVTQPEFGGGYGVVNSPGLMDLIAAVVVHYQNEQGEPRGVDLLVGGRHHDGAVVVDNALLRPLFHRPQIAGAPNSTAANERKAMIDAIIDRIEVDIASRFESTRHANGVFVVGIIQQAGDQRSGSHLD